MPTRWPDWQTDGLPSNGCKCSKRSSWTKTLYFPHLFSIFMGANWSESSHQMQIGAIAAPKAEFVADVRISRNLFQLGFWILYFTCTAGSFWCQYVAWFDPTLGCSLFFSAIPCQQGITIQSHWRRGAISRSWFWFYSESAYTCIQHWFIRDPNLDGPCLNAQGCRIQASVRNVLLFFGSNYLCIHGIMCAGWPG